MTVKSIVLRTSITVALFVCLYGFVAYRSLRSEFRALGLR